MDVKEKLKLIYAEMPELTKQLAHAIHGVTPAYFRRIVNGEPKSEDVYYSAIQACKQALEQRKNEIDIASAKIASIEVDAEEIKNHN